MIDAKEKLEFVHKSEWHQQIDIGDGITTPGLQNSTYKAKRINLPADLSGQTVLDIGANDGYFSLECKRRGARRVVAVDTWPRMYGENKDIPSIQNIMFIKRCTGLNIEIQQLDFLYLNPYETYDVVLFLGVLYHLRDPLRGLCKIAELGKTIILETHVIPGDGSIMKFYPNAELNKDNTNWWGPTSRCVVDMVEAAGMTDIETTDVWGDRLSLHAKGTAA